MLSRGISTRKTIHFLIHSKLQQNLTRFFLDSLNTLSTFITQSNQLNLIIIQQTIDIILIFTIQILKSSQINFSQYDQ